MMVSSGRREAVKIVQIETRYVHTDALNFRDVVQSLTGKNSSSAWVGNGSVTLTHSAVTVKPQEEEGITITTHHHHDYKYKQDASLSSMILKNMSSKDFDRLLSELPPMEDISCSWLVAPSNVAT